MSVRPSYFSTGALDTGTHVWFPMNRALAFNDTMAFHVSSQGNRFSGCYADGGRVVFSGSGMSASAGMSTFSTRGGLYERARRRFGLRGDGVELFTFGFFERRPVDCRALLADH